MVIQDNHGKLVSIDDDRVYRYILNKIPKGIWFYIFVYIVIFGIGVMIGKMI